MCWSKQGLCTDCLLGRCRRVPVVGMERSRAQRGQSGRRTAPLWPCGQSASSQTLASATMPLRGWPDSWATPRAHVCVSCARDWWSRQGGVHWWSWQGEAQVEPRLGMVIGMTQHPRTWLTFSMSGIHSSLSRFPSTTGLSHATPRPLQPRRLRAAPPEHRTRCQR